MYCIPNIQGELNKITFGNFNAKLVVDTAKNVAAENSALLTCL